MEAVFGGPTDLDAWMELVNRVSWNFPGLETGRCFGSFGKGLVGDGQAERNYGLYLSGGGRKGKGSQSVVSEIWIQGGRTDGGVWISQPGVCSASIGLACGAGTAA